MKIIELVKNRGIVETLQTLMDFPLKEAIMTTFLAKLKENGSYYNAYIRVREEMVKNNLISFKLGGNYARVICLTEKGQKVHQKITEIEKILN